MEKLFHYRLPASYIAYKTLYVDGEVKFQPPLYEQRYLVTLGILNDERWKEIKTVVDFGCSTLRFVTMLRRLDRIDKIVAVDIDGDLLELHKSRVDPLLVDYISKSETDRANPLRIEVYKGSIDAQVDQLRDIDAVVGLEVIEHLESNVLDNVPQNVFGFMQPKVAIFSTPNSEFNVLFNLETGFRHPDHKFEWTRDEFNSWANKICTRYPNYKVTFLGVGDPPPNQRKLGHCSQIALFVRTDVLGLPLHMPLLTNIAADLNPDIQFKEIHAVEFPLHRDERTKENKILDEAEYIVSRMRNDQFFNTKRRVYEIPINPLITFAASIDVSEEELRSILRKKADWTAERLCLVLPEFEDFECESDTDDSAESPSAKKVATYESEEDWD